MDPFSIKKVDQKHPIHLSVYRSSTPQLAIVYRNTRIQNFQTLLIRSYIPLLSTLQVHGNSLFL